jgi:hypothetical protein
MPSWYEIKLVKDKYAYVPTAFGGLGIPMTYRSVVEDPEVGLGLRSIEYRQLEGLKLDRKAGGFQIWERGLAYQVPNLDELLAPILDGLEAHDACLTPEEAWDRTREELISNSAYDTVANFRVAKQMYKDYVDICGNVPIVSDKESAYTAYTLGGAVIQVTPKRRRARQVLARLKRDVFVMNERGLIPFDYELKAKESLGKLYWETEYGITDKLPKKQLFLKRTVLEETFKTGLIKPSLTIPAAYFFKSSSGRQCQPVKLPIEEQITLIETIPEQTDFELELERNVQAELLHRDLDADRVNSANTSLSL